MKSQYRYQIRLVRVIDADTIVADVDLGFNVWLHKIRLRLVRVDALELRQPKGKEAKRYVQEVLAKANVLMADTISPDKYHRWDANIWVDGVPLGLLLEEKGYLK